MVTIRRAVAISAALGFAATAAFGQQEHRGGGEGAHQKGQMQGGGEGGMQGGMQGGMMEMMQEHHGGVQGIRAYQPGALLEHRDHLELTPAQVKQLETMAASAPAVDTGKMADMHASLAHFTSAADARAVLTPGQRTMVEEMLGHQEHGGKGGGGGGQHQH